MFCWNTGFITSPYSGNYKLPYLYINNIYIWYVCTHASKTKKWYLLIQNHALQMLLSTIMLNHYYSYPVLNTNISYQITMYINYTTIERTIGIPQLNIMWLLYVRTTQECLQHYFKLKTVLFLSSLVFQLFS